MAEGYPIRTSPDQRLLAAPRSLSQLATSFIAGRNRGIHRTALRSLTTENSRRDNAVVKERRAPSRPIRTGGRVRAISHNSVDRSQTGGPERDRTADLLNANQALSQLSYRPKSWKRSLVRCTRDHFADLPRERIDERFSSKSKLNDECGVAKWWAEQELHL